MYINSEKTFKRVMIENGFEYEDIDDDEYVFYGLNIVRDSLEESKSSFWGSYLKENGEFMFQIGVRSSLGSDFFGRQIESEDNVYNELTEKIGMRVFLKNKKNNSGTLTFEYKGLDQLDRLISIVKNNY